MDGLTNGWIDGRWMDEWIDEWMDGLMTADLPQIIYISLASNGIG